MVVAFPLLGNPLDLPFYFSQSRVDSCLSYHPYIVDVLSGLVGCPPSFSKVFVSLINVHHDRLGSLSLLGLQARSEVHPFPSKISPTSGDR